MKEYEEEIDEEEIDEEEVDEEEIDEEEDDDDGEWVGRLIEQEEKELQEILMNGAGNARNVQQKTKTISSVITVPI